MGLETIRWESFSLGMMMIPAIAIGGFSCIWIVDSRSLLSHCDGSDCHQCHPPIFDEENASSEAGSS